MEAQDFINEIEKEDREIRNHQQSRERKITIDFIIENNLTGNKVKQIQESFYIEKQLEITDKNITRCLNDLKLCHLLNNM